MYYRVSIPLADRSPEFICERLADFDVAGIEEREDSVLAYFESLTEASSAGGELGGGAAEEVVDQNWSAGWQADWTPLLVGERFFLCPSWVDEVTPTGRIRLEMVPGNVFGGGDHPTTQLCLELLERVIEPGMLVADIGAGTGILTQAARALGARAFGCDIDPSAMGMVDFIGSAEALAGCRFDVIVANIHLGVLQELRSELLRLVRPGASLLVSGFLPGQADEISNSFGEFVELRKRQGWCAGIILAHMN